MISVGDLVEWTEMSNAKASRSAIGCIENQVLGIVLRYKTESLDGINKTKLFEVHFPVRQQYWIATGCLKKIA